MATQTTVLDAHEGSTQNGVIPQQRSDAASAILRRSEGASRRSGFRSDIEGLRAVAVIAVVLYHFRLLGLSGGYVGADIFFVISGYLITRQLVGKMGRFDESRRRTITKFYAGRFRRLFPAAALALGGTLILTRLFAPALQQTSIYTDAIFASIYSLNYRLAVTGTDYVHHGDTVSPLQHFWSLAVEEQFYLFWPALLAIVFLVFKTRWIRALLALLIVITVWSLYESYVVTNVAQPWAYFSLLTRAWELGAGALIAVAMVSGAKIPRLLGELLTVGGLALIGYSIFAFTDATVFPGVAAAVPVTGAAFVILGGTRQGLTSSALLAVGPMRFVGRVSYSWYLWHWPLLILAPYILKHELSLKERLILLALTLVVATQSFWIVEESTRVLALISWRWLTVGVVGALTMSLIAICLNINEPPLIGKAPGAASLASGASGSAAARVSGILAQSISTKSVPANLQPSLRAAPNDVSADYYNGCHQNYAYAVPPACAYGDVASKNVAVLFGDSHMEQWLPGFDLAGKGKHWKIINWTKSGCGFADISVFNKTLNRIYTECDKWRAAIVDRISVLHPALVVVSGREDVADGQVSVADWITASKRGIGKFTRAGITVDFLQDTGHLTSVVPECLAANLNAATRCTFSAAGSFIHPQLHQGLAAGMKSVGADVIDPEPWLCAEGTCPVIVGNLLVYRDDNHLTATFSRWLAPIMATILVK